MLSSSTYITPTPTLSSPPPPQPPPFTSTSSPATALPSPPPLKRRRFGAPPLAADLGEYIAHDAALINNIGWDAFVRARRGRNDFGTLQYPHPANTYLRQLHKHGCPVRFHSRPWSYQCLQRALRRGPHKSCASHANFLQEEFADMIGKSQWVVLPFDLAASLGNLTLSPPGVVPQRERRPRWIGDYSFSGVNDDTLPLAPTESMQYGNALHRLLREILIANPANGVVYMAKLDISDGFYRINLAPADIPRLGLVFPSLPHQPPLVALPLVLPMGWKNSPPVFCAATETAADIANSLLVSHPDLPQHRLEHHASVHDDFSLAQCTSRPAASPCPATPRPAPAPAPTPGLVSLPPRPHNLSVPVPKSRDPSLPTPSTPLSYIDVFVDDFLGLCQASSAQPVRRALLHAVDLVFRPTDFYDDVNRREPVSLKKLRQGDLSWTTIKVVLGWLIDTVAMTISLPKHRVERLADILASIPPTQKRTSVRKWHKVLGELRSMSIALPGAQGLFSALQLALSRASGHRISLNKGVHAALDDFRWLLQDVARRPTRIAEIIPLLPSALGYHDASGAGCGGVWFPVPSLGSRHAQPPATPLVWRLQWPPHIRQALITHSNPHGTISISDLELAGGLIHLDVIAQHLDIRERTILSKTDNLAALFWQRKGSATTDAPSAHLLRLFALHQRFHRYVPRHDYEPGLTNPLADAASRLFTLTNPQLLTHFSSHFPQELPWKLVHPTLPMTSSVISALQRTTSTRESLLVAPPLVIHSGTSGSSTPLTWASTPFSKPSKIKYPCFKSSSAEYAQVSFPSRDVPSSLDQLRTTYGLLPRRTSPWGPLTHAPTPMAR